MSSQLPKNILATLAYYDVMDYPLTNFEIWKHLFRMGKDDLGREKDREGDQSLFGINNALSSEGLNRLVEEYRGFYFLKGRKNLVEERIKRNKISEKKFKILLRVARVLRFVPYVRMVAVTGRMAMKNTEEKSDLDLLLVLKHGKIFTGRILVTLAVHLMGRRRYRGKIANRVCLNYFVTTNSLEIGLKDMFSASEYYFMSPLFGRETFEMFQEKNSWIAEYKVNYEKSQAANLKMLPDSFPARFVRQIGEKFLSASFIEKWLRAWQMRRINRNPKTHQAGSLVVAGDKALIFLPSPQGPKIYDKFQERLSSLV